MDHCETAGGVFRLLTETFEGYTPPHRPSPSQSEALSNLIQCVSSVFHGRGERKVYLSSLAPGTGKTTALKAFLRHVAENPHEQTEDGRRYGDVGILICMNTRDEILAFCEDIDTSNVCVWVGQDAGDDFIGLGQVEDPAKAQVLITTHARIEREIEHSWDKDFDDANRLFFKGEPRRLRLWDEAYVPGKPITLSIKEIDRALPYVKEAFPQFAADLQGLIEQVSSAMNPGKPSKRRRSAKVNCPDVFRDLTPQDLVDHLAKDRVRGQQFASLIAVFETLAKFSGKPLVVRHDGPLVGDTLLMHEPTIPDSFLPVIVLDASGAPGIRQTYTEMEQRGLIERIVPPGIKKMRNLTIHHWDVGGGKSSIIQNFDKYIEGIGRWIITFVPGDEEVLIIHHKPEELAETTYATYKVSQYLMRDLQKALEAHMRVNYPDFDCSRLKFTTWGQHRARNVWRQIPNVIAAGTLFKPDSAYEGTLRASRDVGPHEGPARSDELKAFRLGEYADDLIQGLGRSIIRQVDQDDPEVCPPARALVIASKKSGIPDQLENWFPGATVVPVVLIPIDLQGPAGEVIAYLEEWQSKASYGDTITFKELRRRFGLSSKEFANRVRRNKKVVTRLRELRLVEYVRTPGVSIYPEGWQFTSDLQADQRRLHGERIALGFNRSQGSPEQKSHFSI